jgi:hypothetical protein
MALATLEFSESEVLLLLNEAEHLLESLLSEGPQSAEEITAVGFLTASSTMDSVSRMLRLLILQASRDCDERPFEPPLVSPENLTRFEEAMTGIVRYTETLMLRFGAAPELRN